MQDDRVGFLGSFKLEERYTKQQKKRKKKEEVHAASESLQQKLRSSAPSSQMTVIFWAAMRLYSTNVCNKEILCGNSTLRKAFLSIVAINNLCS